MGKFSVFLSDSDGTLLDTAEFIDQAFIHAFSTHFGITLLKDHLVTVAGKPLGECYRVLGSYYEIEMSDKDIIEYCQTHNAFQAENMHLAQPFDETVATLEQIKLAGIPIAVITSRTINAKYLLEEAGILHYFDLLVTADDVKNHKPHPEGVEMALRFFNVPAIEAVMMGDTDADILAGKAAQVATIGVTYGTMGHAIKNAQPDYVIDHISEVLPILL